MLAHHLVGERGKQHLLGGPGYEFGQVLGLDPARQQDLADLPVQVGAAAGQGAPVPVCRGDHRQQQRIDRQVLERRILPEQGGEPGGGSRLRIRTARRPARPEPPVACRSAARYQRSRNTRT